MSSSSKRPFGLILALALALSFVLPAVSFGPSASANAGVVREWVVVFNQPSGLPQNVDSMVANAGGSITARLPQVGAIAATSDNPDFAAILTRNPQVQAVSENVEQQLIPEDQGLSALDADNNGGQPSPAGPDPQPGSEPLYHQQWDKMRVNASATGSYAVQPGRKDVVVAVLDTGVELSPVPHPDIVPNLDLARSRSFVPSEPDLDDRNGHGSWCLSAVAAPINEFGISGVAPNVTLVSLKVLSGAGRGSFLGVAQALIYSGENHFDVASMSLGGYINHSDSNALYVLLNRSVQFARANGVTPIAALANNNFDLADGAFFRDFIEVPGELPGVIGVSATGYYNQKSFYSNYGVGKADVSAPGGDSRFQLPPPPYGGRGRVLGAWATETIGTFSPVLVEEQCDVDSGCVFYAYVQGTSMATPNAAGVAALIISQYGDFETRNPQMSHLPPTTVESILQITANNQPCPEPNTVSGGPGFGTATCQGDAGYNGFYGKGIVDALNAVTYYNR